MSRNAAACGGLPAPRWRAYTAAMESIREITGRTQTFAVFGHPVAHSLSPPMQNAGLAALGLNAVYTAYDVSPADLMAALEGCRAMGFGGVNLTVPLKQVAFAHLGRLDRSAERARAVNTVVFGAHGMCGHNTDAHGFLRDFGDCFGRGLAGDAVCILGTGGAARGVALAAADEGATRIVLVGRRMERVRALVEELDALESRATVKGHAFDDPAWVDACRATGTVVQSTPVGMRAGEASIAPREAFREGQCAYDLIYTARETVFMQAARAGGAEAVNGLGMLLHQGARALSIWTDREAPVQAMREALEHAVYARDAS